MSSANDFRFTNNWFLSTAKPVWDSLIPQIRPKAVLEIGCFEGASTCYLIEQVAAYQDLEITCVDSWAGGQGQKDCGIDYSRMSEALALFTENTGLAIKMSRHKVDLRVIQGLSEYELPRLLVEGKKNHFDFIYVDGSHQAPDVLSDAVEAFKLLKVGGVIAFDDYLWQEQLPTGIDPLRCPKPAIDAFVNIYLRKVRVLRALLNQLYVQKISD